MIRMLGWFSIERTLGLFMIMTALLLARDPYAAALDRLDMLYSIDIPVSLFIASLFVAGMTLMLLRTVRMAVYLLTLLPLAIYSLALFGTYRLVPHTGVMGAAFGIGFCVWCVYTRAARGDRK